MSAIPPPAKKKKSFFPWVRSSPGLIPLPLGPCGKSPFLLFLVPVVNLFLLVPGVELQGRVLLSCKEKENETFGAAKKKRMSPFELQREEMKQRDKLIIICNFNVILKQLPLPRFEPRTQVRS